MSLAGLNTTPIHERGIVYHVEYDHLKRDAAGQAVYERTGGTDEDPEFGPVILRTEKLMNGDKPVELIIAGPDSDRVSLAQLATFDIQRRAAFDERPVSTQESRDSNVMRWAGAVIGWNNVPRGWVEAYDPNDPAQVATADDPIAYSDKNARAMFNQAGMTWLGQKVDKLLMERNRFLPSGSTNSEPSPPPSPKRPKLARPRSRPV